MWGQRSSCLAQGTLGPEGLTKLGSIEECWDPNPWGKKTDSRCRGGTGRLDASSRDNTGKGSRHLLSENYELERVKVRVRALGAAWNHHIINTNNWCNNNNNTNISQALIHVSIFYARTHSIFTSL